MSKVDISALSKAELSKLIQKSRREMKKRERVEASAPKIRSSDPRVKEIANKVRDLANELGITKREALGALAGNLRISVTQASRTRSEPKYRDPDNAANVWTGTGARPRWLKAKLAAGHKLEEFAIREN